MTPSQSQDVCLSSTFQGRIWPRTGCTFDNVTNLCSPPTQKCCDSGSCSDANNNFALVCANSGAIPTTIAEFTFHNNGGTDFYDVSVVDGYSIPVQINVKENTYKIRLGADVYYCGAPGCTSVTCPTFSSDLVPCTWNLVAAGPTYASQMHKVGVGLTGCSGSNSSCNCTTDGFCGCKVDTDCPTGTQCGIVQYKGNYVQICGPIVGWYGPAKLCSMDPTLGEPLNCNAAVPGQGTRLDLYSCTGANGESCYTPNTTSNCCGCAPWSDPGTCNNTNPAWTQYVEPFVGVFKNACRSAYSFQYDDPTSTFTCGNISATVGVGYVVTFCPAGSPGSSTYVPPTSGTSYTSSSVTSSGTGTSSSSGSSSGTSSGTSSSGSSSGTSSKSVTSSGTSSSSSTSSGFSLSLSCLIYIIYLIWLV